MTLIFAASREAHRLDVRRHPDVDEALVLVALRRRA